MGNIASHTSSAPRQLADGAAVRGIISGQTVIVLENGDVVCGRIVPKSVKINPTRDPDGGMNYDVEWEIEMAKVGKS